MLNHLLRKLLAVTILTLLASSAMAGAATAATQLLETEEFSLTVSTTFCEPGYLGPFVGCTPWDGVTVSVLYDTPAGIISDACVTVAGERDATCTVNVPFGQTVTALINPAMIPAGYVLEGSPEVQVTIPDGPPEGLFTGPAFVLFQSEAPAEEPAAPGGFPLGASTAFCEPSYMGPFVGCTPWEGVTVSFVSSDGSFTASCVTSGSDRAAGCGVEVPFGSTIIASIDPAVIPAGYVLERSASVEIAIPDGPPQGEFSGATFVLLPAAPPAETTSPADETPAITPSVMTAAIYTGTCDAPLPESPVAELVDARQATGAQVGFADAIPVATSYTVIDIPFDQILDGTHVLVVVDAANPDARIACGGLGGTLDDNGALAVGLSSEGDSGFSVVAYIAPVDDGAGAAITLFVSMPPVPAP